MKIESEVLRRLGMFPFWKGDVKALSTLDKLYQRAARNVERKSEEVKVKSER